MNRDTIPSSPVRIVVMGVAGSGKTTLARPLAERLGAQLIEADDLHPQSNIAKMSRGEALTDADRWPWLDRVADEMGTTRLAVATCSALKQAYRDVLRRVAGVRFVYLDIDETTALARLRSRPDHFMGPDMVAGQFAALERPALDEDDVIRVDATADAGPIVESILDWLIRAPGTG